MGIPFLGIESFTILMKFSLVTLNAFSGEIKQLHILRDHPQGPFRLRGPSKMKSMEFLQKEMERYLKTLFELKFTLIEDVQISSIHYMETLNSPIALDGNIEERDLFCKRIKEEEAILNELVRKSVDHYIFTMQNLVSELKGIIKSL